jgi:peptidoglycan hydrolase-like protein with peptidoglycan-binding domain
VTSPAAHARGAVDVTVTTPKGTSATAAADQFVYDAATAAPLGADVKPVGRSVADGQRRSLTASKAADVTGLICTRGVDFAYGQGITTEQLQAAGVQFVCRYLSGGTSKDICQEELDNYKNAGIAVVLNWETDGQMPDETQGVADAQAAQQEAASLGEPDAPIIFSADFDPASDGVDGILAYMRGVASVLGKDRTGLYGGMAAIEAYFNANIGTYGWQTSAWSGGQWDSRAQLQQYNYNLVIGPAEVDQDRAMAARFGQIGPMPPSTPAPVPGNWPTVQEGSAGVVVKVLQYLLNDRGASLTVDGIDGPLTTAALERVQRSAGITVDGIANGQTWPKLIVDVAEGDTGDAVEALQTALNGAGANLTVDGDDGPLTTQAVGSFQTAHNITETGQAGSATWEALLFGAATAEEENARLLRPGRRH